MSTLIVIPARYQSSRYPGKPLATLTGAGGKSMSLIERSWRAAMSVKGVDAVTVATDDERIAEAAQAFGADVTMTSEDCANGTERCVDALRVRGEEPAIVVNLQGDAPLTPPWFVEELIAAMADGAAVATPVLRCDETTYSNFVEDRRAGRVGGTTAVFSATMQALYFSKEVIPYIGHILEPGAPVPVFHHVGLYAYTPDALRAYAAATPGPLEALEGLEQLRFLENDVPIRCVEVDGRGRVFWELNNPEDIPRIEAALKAEGLD
jgi:3-deoxy-manno-octulosonate cytidylyltransferase (CMP-KDO synthetase)